MRAPSTLLRHVLLPAMTPALNPPTSLPRSCGGVTAALPTPFDAGQVDTRALTLMVERQVAAGVAGIACCGTTGEAPTLNLSERETVMRCCVEAAAGRATVFAGIDANGTDAAVTLGRIAEDAGADMLLISVPFYNKPSQRGLLTHFEQLARKLRTPIFIHNCPAHTGVDLAPHTLERLAELAGIAGLVDGTGDLRRLPYYTAAFGDRFTLLSGHDGTAPAFVALGGHGMVSTVANIVPGMCVAIMEAWHQGDMARGVALTRQLWKLVAAVEIEPAPASVKHALHLLHGLSPAVRLPLVTIEESSAAAIEEALEHLERQPY